MLWVWNEVIHAGVGERVLQADWKANMLCSIICLLECRDITIPGSVEIAADEVARRSVAFV
jgi:hypothetical protein